MNEDGRPPRDGDGGAYVRTEFLERVGHELRGPSGVTLGALDEMELALGDRASELSSLFALARRGVRRVTHTAERLQRTAWLERGNVAWVFAPVDFGTLLENAVRDAELLEARRGVMVTLTGLAAPSTVCVDAPWMTLAVAELVMNAIAHARRAVSIRAELTDRGVAVSVTDDGAGFTGPPPPRFHPPRDLRGLGLSLSLACDVVIAHGGAIDLNVPMASDGHGAHVRLVIPLREPASVPPFDVHAQAPALKAVKR